MSPPRSSIGHYSHGRDNNFNVLRVLAASLVLLTHAFGITGNGHLEPLKRLFDISFGSWAVDVFFAVSGFLVCKSWYRDPSPSHFLLARGVRIYPALWVCILVCAVIIGPVFTTLPLPTYFKHPQLFRFVVANATLLPKGVSTTLPGVFEGLSVNSPLWTLPYELKMYLGLLALGWSGLLHRRGTAPCITLAALAGYAYGVSTGDPEGAIPQYCRFVFCFSAGAWLYLERDRLKVRPLFAAALLLAIAGSALTRDVHWRLLTLTIATPYLSLYAALIPTGLIRRYNRLGDYSYGIYIYGNPVQLMVLSLSPDKTDYIHNFFLSWCITVSLAVASWHLLESHALRLKQSRGATPAEIRRPVDRSFDGEAR